MKTVTEAAKLLGVSRGTILNWINSGVIKAIQPVREYRISEKEIERLMGNDENEKGEE